MSVTIYPVVGKEKRLPFYLTGVGISDPEYHVRRESGLISHQIMLTAKGKGILKIGGAEYTQTKGTCVYLPPSVPHTYEPISDQNGEICWETWWLVFRGEGISESMRSLGFAHAEVRDLKSTEELTHIFKKIIAAAADPIYGGEKCSELVYSYILKCRRLMLEDCGTSCSDSIIERAVGFIDRSFSQDIALSDLAEMSGVSQQHFCRLFRSAMGMRPMEYVAKKRIARAKLLLEDTSLPIGEIARQVGYSGITYFGMVFKKYEGISPTQFRSHEII